MKIYLLVIDSLGIGAMCDAADYGDEGSNTYRAISEYLRIPNMRAMGFEAIDGIARDTAHTATIARLAESSKGKDTTTGHWEIAGVVTTKPYPTYPNGFPDSVISALEKAFGTRVIGNMAISGTKVLEDLGPLHLATGYPIVYTSADSVLQIAAHTSVIPLDKLYTMCKQARAIMHGEHAVGRIIARPFEGEVGHFVRTADRKDFSLIIPDNNMLTILQKRGFEVKSVGKINDIFAGVGITEHLGGHTNKEVLDLVKAQLDADYSGLVFANLVETDMLFGHRNDVRGYAECVNTIDIAIGEMVERMAANDILIITADHGCDPSTPSTDHSREYVPLIIYSTRLQPENWGTCQGFFTISKFVLEQLK